LQRLLIDRHVRPDNLNTCWPYALYMLHLFSVISTLPYAVGEISVLEISYISFHCFISEVRLFSLRFYPKKKCQPAITIMYFVSVFLCPRESVLACMRWRSRVYVSSYFLTSRNFANFTSFFSSFSQ
jgi:hypothetical protein